MEGLENPGMHKGLETLEELEMAEEQERTQDAMVFETSLQYLGCSRLKSFLNESECA